MKLDKLLTVFRAVAPEQLAEDWDQVGVHLAGDGKPINKALLCIDLTPPVLDEAFAQKCKLIVAYHPPIFQPLKRLADRDWKETMLALAIRKGIAVYSPHTALDAVREGMNDWLCEGLGKHGTRWSIGLPKAHRTHRFKIAVYVPNDAVAAVRDAMFKAGGGGIGQYTECSFNLQGVGTFKGNPGTNPTIGKPGRREQVEETRIEMISWQGPLGDVLKAARQAHPYEEPAIDVFELAPELPPETEEQTPGRIAVLDKPVTAKAIISRVKKTLGMKHLKASVPEHYGIDQPRATNPMTGEEIKIGSGKKNLIQTIAVCVGAGGSLFEKYPHADAYITGEMQQHQILDLHQQGKVVILAGHTNTERPFLGRYRDRLVEEGGDGVEWLISEADRAPMSVV